jgi:nucleoside-diphosphate-sugar epimerase
MKRKVILFGGAGYVGSMLAPKLVEKGFEVLVYDTFWYGIELFKKMDNLKLIQGDVRDLGLVGKSLNGITDVIHLACISNDPSFDLNPNLGKSINLTSFEPLVKAAKQQGVQRFIYASSSSVYGIKYEPNVTEELPLDPLTDYSKFKAKCEEILLSHASNNFICTILRPATICGYSARQRFDLVVNILTNQAINNGQIKVLGGTQYRPNLHISDMIDAYLFVLSQNELNIKGEIFNINGENLTLNQIASKVSDVTDVNKIEYQQTNDLRSYRVDASKIKTKLGFSPKFSVNDAILEIKKALLDGKFKDPLNNSLYFNIKRMQELKIK